MQVAHVESSIGRIIKICGIANSKTMIIADPATAQGLNLELWQEELAKVTSPSHRSIHAYLNYCWQENQQQQTLGLERHYYSAPEWIL